MVGLVIMEKYGLSAGTNRVLEFVFYSNSRNITLKTQLSINDGNEQKFNNESNETAEKCISQ